MTTRDERIKELRAELEILEAEVMEEKLTYVKINGKRVEYIARKKIGIGRTAYQPDTQSFEWIPATPIIVVEVEE